MKVSIRLALTFAFLVGSLAVFGQRKMVSDQLLWAESISVDGDLSDWGTKLKNENTAQKMSFEIRNDDQYLFVAVRIVEQQRQVQAITQGISFMLNPEGKRKDGPGIVFPAVDRISFRAMMSSENDDRPKDLRIGALQSVRGIQVFRIGDLLDGLISLDNQYGVQASANIDADDALCVEMRLPLSLIASQNIIDKEQIAYNIKIGGRGMGSSPQAQRPISRTDAGAYPGYGSRGGFGPSAPREDAGIWGLIRFADSHEPSK